jgi:hypothetical protein
MCLGSRQRFAVALQPSAGAVELRPARVDSALSTNSRNASRPRSVEGGAAICLEAHRNRPPCHGLSVLSTRTPMRPAGRSARKAFTPDLKFLQLALARGPPT